MNKNKQSIIVPLVMQYLLNIIHFLVVPVVLGYYPSDIISQEVIGSSFIVSFVFELSNGIKMKFWLLSIILYFSLVLIFHRDNTLYGINNTEFIPSIIVIIIITIISALSQLVGMLLAKLIRKLFNKYEE